MKKQIKFDRTTRDYSMFLNGRYVGSRATYPEAENELNRLAFGALTK